MLNLKPASGDAPGWTNRFIYGPVSRLTNFTLSWIPRACKAALSLTGEQRQTLMSWGLIGGVVILTALKFWSQREMHLHWKESMNLRLQEEVIDGLFSQLTWDTVLQGVFVVGIVAIAKGGAMLVSISKAGATMDFQASGSAAKTLAAESGGLSPTSPAPAPAPARAPATPPPPPYQGESIPPPKPGTPEKPSWP
ncbi:MAG TPA: hypothetical protein VFH89_04790 [Sphingomicrobium sp.]|nr:hypothetical protein [Sphingomicrobium sp.]